MGGPRPRRAKRLQLAAKAGWSPKGSRLRNRLSELEPPGWSNTRSRGLNQPHQKRAEATPAADTSQTLIDAIRAVRPARQRQIFRKSFTRGAPGARPSRAEIAGRLAGAGQVRTCATA